VTTPGDTGRRWRAVGTGGAMLEITRDLSSSAIANVNVNREFM